MSREWKPGDVVAARVMSKDVRGIIDADGQFYTTDRRFRGISSTVFAPENLRRLVVIDPEDREHVQRALAAWFGTSPAGVTAEEVTRAQNAYRSLVTPPKPDEPTGRYAVIEDGDVTWVRAAWANSRQPGRLAHHDPAVAELIEQARAEGAAAALREAAGDVVQSVVTTAHVAICEAQYRSDKTAAHIALDEVEGWLRARADRLAPTTEAGEVRRDG